jgi:hypothetical protein
VKVEGVAVEHVQTRRIVFCKQTWVENPELCNGRYMFDRVNMVISNYPARCPFHW